MFKSKVLCHLVDIHERVKRMSEVVDNFVKDARKSMQETSDSLKNIAADEDRLVRQFEGLTRQYNELLANGGVISNADLEALTVFGNDLRSVAASSRAIADAQPDPAPAV